MNGFGNQGCISHNPTPNEIEKPVENLPLVALGMPTLGILIGQEDRLRVAVGFCRVNPRFIDFSTTYTNSTSKIEF
jgi:hypothetical protein